LFVVRLDAARAQVIVGQRGTLASSSILLRDVNWQEPVDHTMECAVKIRSMRPPVAAKVTPTPGGAAQVELAAPEDAIAPGQACVFYDGSRVLGGGWIKPAAAAAA
jgi:tRNA-specific 2-thiouridylase